MVVIQARRLASKLMCNRVNQTMVLTERNESMLAGLYVSGSQNNVKAPILYITDGLMKEFLLNDHESFYIEKNHKTIVFMLEVYERNVNCDLCIALFLRILVEKPHLRGKVKLVLTSSTISDSITALLNRVQGLNVGQLTDLAIPTPYRVKEVQRPNDNLLDVVQELYAKRSHRQDQILCFVSSVVEVYQSCQLLAERTRNAIRAHPLIQSQSVYEQQQIIERGSVFFSSSVAETSLTFPSLAYVVDTGMVYRSVYDFKTKRTIIQEMCAGTATIVQRMGRLGRTQPGEYHSLYDHNVNNKTNSIPQICQIRLTDLEFVLRRTQSIGGLKYLKRYLPDPPTDPHIQSSINELKESGNILGRIEIFVDTRRHLIVERAIQNFLWLQ